ncbi:hypothetical protein [Nonomuraea jabiensis]|uniref:Uncharacterized protein n=1 Tax=Nonomuraea jabiensis TaxID=882448 RepID=A0A7W9GHD7_9ACTN|nr:hypothetical protein [Nonomuraea jabiensis]MBB5783840.1 hypothetical protein [Nonomuraea jabiensis]
MGSRAAISAGVLAVALAAVPGAATAATAGAQDCTRDGGLLSGVTNTLCDVVNTLTGTVDTLTGGTTKKVTDGVNDTTDEVLGRVGEVAPTTRSTPDARTSPSPSASATEQGDDPLDTGCRPGQACADEDTTLKLTPSPSPSPSRTSRPREWGVESLPSKRPTAPEQRPQTMDTGRPVIEKETKAHTDEPRVDLLWPNPFAHELTLPMQDKRVVRPSPPASDVLGTALTIALLGSAVLATRIVQQRRQRTEPVESIPFEPARAGSGSGAGNSNGRHRLA